MTIIRGATKEGVVAKTTERVEYIDIAKGIGILLVVFGHAIRGENYNIPNAQPVDFFIYSFHMPLFFVISGLCIKNTKSLSVLTIKNMARAYLVPFAIWTVIYVLLFETIALVKGQASIICFQNPVFAHAISICGVAPLWFLLALFIAEAVTLWIKSLLPSGGGVLCNTAYIGAVVHWRFILV